MDLHVLPLVCAIVAGVVLGSGACRWASFRAHAEVARARQRLLGAVLAGLLSSLILAACPITTTASATAFTYDGPSIARVGVGDRGSTEARPAPVSDVQARSAFPSVEVRGTTTTPSVAVVATEEGSILNFGSKAAAREGLAGDAGTAANRFFRDATSKSIDFQAQELGNGGYRLQFFSPANNPGYGKLYVQEIDAAGNVIREFKNTLGPDGLIETKGVHGGP